MDKHSTTFNPQDGRTRSPEQKKSDRYRLPMLDGATLQNLVLPPKMFVVDGLIPQGLTLLTAAQKTGKSWMALNLCLSVAQGTNFLGRKTTQGKALYLALEDTPQRLQDRQNKLLCSEDAPSGVYYVCGAIPYRIDSGLLDALALCLLEHPAIRLVVIDTFQMVRNGPSRKEGAYEADYRDASALKQFADKHRLAIVLIHHTRKEEASKDPFDLISGTMGLPGAADTSIVLVRKRRRGGNAAADDGLMYITGRDVEEAEYSIAFDTADMRWRMLGGADELQQAQELADYNADPVVRAIKAALAKNGTWSGTCTKLQAYGSDMPNANVVSKKIRALTSQLLKNDGITYQTDRNGHTGTIFTFFALGHQQSDSN